MTVSKRKKSKVFAGLNPLIQETHLPQNKLEHFYHSYNKSLFIEDAMDFSDGENEGEVSNPTKNASNSRKWSVIQSKLSPILSSFD